MATAPRLTAAQARHMAAVRSQADRIATAGGHKIIWQGTFSDDYTGTPYRCQDGWCSQGGRAHCCATISTADATIIWRSGKPTDPCPGR